MELFTVAINFLVLPLNNTYMYKFILFKKKKNYLQNVQMSN